MQKQRLCRYHVCERLETNSISIIYLLFGYFNYYEFMDLGRCSLFALRHRRRLSMLLIGFIVIQFSFISSHTRLCVVNAMLVSDNRVQQQTSGNQISTNLSS